MNREASHLNEYLDVAPEVASALKQGGAVVALESTIISHGSVSSNLECALTAERCVRDEGAVPATIAILGGRLTVGLDRSQIERLATAGAENVTKASRRDIACSSHGAPTGDHGRGNDVDRGARRHQGLRYRRHRRGHRGAQDTLDISADLLELARTPVAVVCAGAKSISTSVSRSKSSRPTASRSWDTAPTISRPSTPAAAGSASTPALRLRRADRRCLAGAARSGARRWNDYRQSHRR